MITEDYVSFETAKLLKEKGFNWEVHRSYLVNDNCFVPADVNDLPDRKDAIRIPTLQMAMKWLREVHNIDIVVTLHRPNSTKWYFWDAYTDSDVHYSKFINGYAYRKNEDACEAAIKYCLKNLIKNEDVEEESGISVPKTVNEAISTLEKILSDDDKEYLLKNGAISMHSSLGRWIRNEWGLWTDSKLKDELKKKGFEHPDDMSNYIIEELIKYWNNKI